MKLVLLLILFTAISCMQSCNDSDKFADKCPTWRRYCRTLKWRWFMKKHCLNTCQNYCPKLACNDKNVLVCTIMSKPEKDYPRGKCSKKKFEKFMRVNCKKSCGFCVSTLNIQGELNLMLIKISVIDSVPLEFVISI